MSTAAAASAATALDASTKLPMRQVCAACTDYSRASCTFMPKLTSNRQNFDQFSKRKTLHFKLLNALKTFI
jgi:hypothetical protein